MNEANYWRDQCEVRRFHGYGSIVLDPWCRRLLSEAAIMPPSPVGIDGYRWQFGDGSVLLATSQIVVVN